MAAIAANAFVWDNVYEIVRSKLTTQPDFAEGTARWKQIDQVLHRGFKFNDRVRSMMRTLLGDLFPLRDSAVHPRSAHEHSVQFAAIDRGVPLVHYRFHAENAARATNATWVIAELHRVTRDSEAAVAEWAQDVVDRLPEQRPGWDVPGDFHLPDAPPSEEESTSAEEDRDS